MNLKKTILPVVLVLGFSLLIFLSSVPDFNLTGKVVAGDTIVPAIECSQSNTLFRVSSERNAHAELYQALEDYNYDYAVCSPFGLNSPGRDCNENEIIRLSAETNAHVEQIDEINYDEQYDVCYGDLACEYVTEGPCSAGDTCLFSISAETNAHISECGVYGIKVCCNSARSGVVDLFPNDQCSTEEFRDECETDACPVGSLRYNNLCISTCNNDQVDSGERCDTCYPDAGCVSGQVCCIDPSNLQGSCRTSCGSFAILPGGCASGKVDANGKCVCNAGGDGLCDEKDTACLNVDPDCELQGTCHIEDGEWEFDAAEEDDSVEIIIFTNEFCEGQTASFEVFENDTGSDTRATRMPANAMITDAEATTTWNAEYIDDGFLQGDPEYYFVARIGSAQFTSGLLEVSEGTGAGGVCGNDDVDAGESCATCSEDAGCYEGEVCCGSGSTATCLEGCSQGDQPEPGGCAPGLTYDSDLDECSCKTTEDNVCPDIDTGCFFEDPDCDDGDGIDDEDVCPMSRDPNQLDMDSDVQGNLLDDCEFGIAGLGEFGISTGRDYFCGGDVCDLDADDDGVCDRVVPTAFEAADRDSLDPASGKLCFGRDRCIVDTNGEPVNDEPGLQQGCTDQDVTCMVQWDCSRVNWGPCVNGLQTRNIGDCSAAGILLSQQTGGTQGCKCEISGLTDSCRSNAAYRPSTQEACLETQEAVEEDFPFFTLVNALITLMLIAGFYAWRK